MDREGYVGEWIVYRARVIEQVTKGSLLLVCLVNSWQTVYNTWLLFFIVLLRNNKMNKQKDKRRVVF